MISCQRVCSANFVSCWKHLRRKVETQKFIRCRAALSCFLYHLAKRSGNSRVIPLKGQNYTQHSQTFLRPRFIRWNTQLATGTDSEKCHPLSRTLINDPNLRAVVNNNHELSTASDASFNQDTCCRKRKPSAFDGERLCVNSNNKYLFNRISFHAACTQ